MSALMGRLLSRVSFQAAFFLLAALGTVVIATAFGFLGLRVVDESNQQVLEERLLLARTSARYIDAILEQDLQQLNLAIQSRPIPWEGGSDAGDFYDSLKQRLYITPEFLALADYRGTIQWTTPDVGELDGASVVAVPAIKTVLKTGEPSTSSLVSNLVSGRPLILLAVAVRDEENEVTGVMQLAVDPTASRMTDWIQLLGLGETGYGQIVDNNGIVLASTVPSYIFERAEHGPQFAAFIQRGTPTKGSCHSCHQTARRKDVLAFAPLSNAPWGVAIQQSEEEAFAASHQLRRQLIYSGVGAFFAALGIAWLASRLFTRQVSHLASASQRIAGGDLASPVEPYGFKELSALAGSFETMRASLKTSREQMQHWQDELEQRVSERTRELLSLVQASEALISSLDPETVLKSIVEAAVKTFAADGGTLFLWDPMQQALVPKAVVGYHTEELSRVRLKPGEGIAGKSFLSGEVLSANDMTQAESMLTNLSDENRARLAAARGERPIQAFLSVPLTFRGQPLGTLFLAIMKEGGGFSPSHQQLAQTFARLASALLENLRLLHEASEAQALRQADQLKTDFLSNISHELQTPLASLKASLEFMTPASSGDTGTMQATLIANARRNAERLQKLVSDLIDVARLQNLQLRLQREPLDLRDTVQDAVGTFGPLLSQKDQVIETVVPEKPVIVEGDERRLEQVLINLIMNAHQHSPAGGHMTVTLQDEDDRVVISVADTGSGIAPEEKEHIFQRFYRASPEQGHSGLGLGLAIARGLVELHGGRIWVESEPGRGSAFRFSLPKEANSESADSG